MKAGRLREIIEEISQRDKLTLSDIAVKVNSNRSYLSKFINGDSEKDMTEGLIRKFTKNFPGYFKPDNRNHKNVSRATLENNNPEIGAKLDPAKLLTILENLSIGHREACEGVNKMADNERMILLKIPMTDAAEGILLADPSILVPLAEILAEISTGKLKFHTTEEAAKELGMRLGQHRPYTKNSKDTRVGEGK